MNKRQVAKYQRLNSPNYRNKRRNKKNRRLKSWLLSILALLFIGLVAIGYYLYTSPAGRNAEVVYIYVRPNTNLQDLEEQLHKRVWLHHPLVWRYLAQYKRLEEKLQPGRYAIAPKMSTSDIIEMLSTGAQTPVRFSLGGERTPSEITTHVASYLLMEQSKLDSLLSNQHFCDSLGFDLDNIRNIFLAGDYEVLWDASPHTLIDSLHNRYTTFWDSTRLKQAGRLGLTPNQVMTIASIVEEESAKEDEYSRIAGLYINRLRKGIKLQSDPTVKYALGNFSLRRILYEHLKVSSPYNTYLVAGLPPAPIRIPRQKSIDLVLQAEEHKYLYMCAKEDFSGRHNFAEQYEQHLVNARKYQRALDARGIK